MNRKKLISTLTLLCIIFTIFIGNSVSAVTFEETTISHINVGDSRTKFNVFAKAGERIEIKSETNQPGWFFKLIDDVNPLGPDYVDVNGNGVFDPGVDTLNNCNITPVARPDDGTHTFDVIVKDSNGNTVYQTNANNNLNIGVLNYNLNILTAPVSKDDTYTISFKSNPNWTEGITYFDLTTCNGRNIKANSDVAHTRTKWSFNVLDNNANPIDGRIWTKELFLEQLTNGSSNGDIYTVSDVGYTYKVKIYDYQGWTSVIRFSSLGIVDSKGTPINKSVWLHPNNPKVSTSGLYKLFFEAPASDLPTSVVRTPIDTSGALLAKVVDFKQTEDGYANIKEKTGYIKHYLTPEFTGKYSIQIDTNANGQFNDAVDVTIDAVAQGGAANGSAANPISIYWNGLDGLGNPVSLLQQVEAKIIIDNMSSIYFTFLDVEQLSGISAEQLNGTGAGNTVLYWDDSGYSGDAVEKKWDEHRGSADNTYNNLKTVPMSLLNGSYPLNNNAGMNSNVPGGVHGWKMYVVSPTDINTTWGNTRIIQSWMKSGISAAALNNTKGILKKDEIKHKVTTEVVNGTINSGATVDHLDNYNVVFNANKGHKLVSVEVNGKKLSAKELANYLNNPTNSTYGLNKITKDMHVKVVYTKATSNASITTDSKAGVPTTGQSYLMILLPLSIIISIATAICIYTNKRK